MGDSEQLTATQRRAIAALLTARDTRAAAKAAKIGETTLHRWLSQPAFKEALSVAEGELISAATRRLLQYQDPAISVIASIMADKELTPSVRLRAATTILDFMLKLREMRDLEERLSRLEAAYAQQTR